MAPTPEAKPTPAYTFPDNLQSYANNEIHATTGFSGPDALSVLNDFIQHATIPENKAEFNVVQVQGYELGAEVVDGYLINYYGIKTATEKQVFFATNYGLINSKGQAFLYTPRAAYPGNGGGGSLISIKKMQETLNDNIGNEIIFSLISPIKTPAKLNDGRPREEYIKQGAVAQKLMEYLIAAKKSYTEVPIDPILVPLLNQRATSVNLQNIPFVDDVMPHTK